jgi:hypothetical protein
MFSVQDKRVEVGGSNEFIYDTLGRVDSEVEFTAQLQPEMSWAEVIVSDRIISIKVNSEKAEIGLFKISLVLEGIDPAYDYESEATYDFELLVKEKALSAVENLAWLEEL